MAIKELQFGISESFYSQIVSVYYYASGLCKNPLNLIGKHLQK